MRILYVQSGFNVGGVALRSLEYVQALRAREVEVDVLTITARADSEWIREAVKSSGACISVLPWPLSAPRSGRWVTRMMSQRKYDAVHAVVNHTSGPFMYIAYMVGIPIRVAHYRVARLEYPNILRRIRARFWRHRVLRYATHVICVSEAVRDALFPRHNSSDCRFHVVPNGLSERYFSTGDPAPTNTAEARGPILGFVGRLSPQKMPFDFLDALQIIKSNCRDAQGVMVGDGPLRAALEIRIQELGLTDSVSLAGTVADVRSYYRTIDVLLLTTAFEGLPGVVLEAQAQGLPIVAYDAPGVREALAPGQVLVPIGDTHALATAAVQLLEKPEVRQRIGREAREWTWRHFRLDDIVETWLRIYQGEAHDAGMR